MEAKDTLMTNEQMKTVILKWRSPETRLSDIFLEPWDDAIAQIQAEISFTAGVETEGERLHAYLKALLAVNPKASLANTIDLIEATRLPGETEE